MSRKDRSNIKILVVEDEILSATDIIETVRSFGFLPVGPVSSGEDAIKLASSEEPDIILMDINLRGKIDGITAAKEIRAKRSTPVIYITAHSDDLTIERVKKNEPYGFISKPFDDRDIYLAVEIALGKIEAEKKFVKKEQWYSRILGSIGDGVIATNSDEEIVYMNTAAEIMTGYTLAEAVNMNIRSVFTVMNGSSGREAGEVHDSFEFNTIEVSSFIKNNILKSRNGFQRSIDYNVFALDASASEKSGGVFVFRDITERLDAQLAIRESFGHLQKAMSGIIEAMVLTVESRDPYTAGHQRRVSNLADMISKMMDIGTDKSDGTRMAGIIHDLGKISIPAEILSKPGGLSEAEFSLIKLHPQAGYDILKKIDFPWPVADIVYQHHERIDGSGYPRHLVKDQILIEARIIAVADVVEAMASHRPYRASLGMEAAIKEINDKKNIYYDGTVVEACIAAVKEKGFEF